MIKLTKLLTQLNIKSEFSTLKNKRKTIPKTHVVLGDNSCKDLLGVQLFLTVGDYKKLTKLTQKEILHTCKNLNTTLVFTPYEKHLLNTIFGHCTKTKLTLLEK